MELNETGKKVGAEKLKVNKKAKEVESLLEMLKHLRAVRVNYRGKKSVNTREAFIYNGREFSRGTAKTLMSAAIYVSKTNDDY